MKKLLNVLRRFVDFVSRILLAAAVAALWGIIIVVTAGAISRYFFNSPLTWTEEMATIFLIYSSFFSVASAIARKKDVIVDVFTSRMHAKTRRIVKIVGNILTLIFFGFLVYSVFLVPKGLSEITVALKIPRIVFYYPMMIVAPFMFLVYLVDTLETFVGIREEYESVHL